MFTEHSPRPKIGFLRPLRTSVGIALAMIAGVQAQTVHHAATAEAQTKQAIASSYLNMPLRFEPNQGQTDSRVQFVSSGANYSLFLTPADAVLALRTQEGKSATLQMVIAGGNPQAPVTGLEPFQSRSNYFAGNDPAKWRANVPDYARVRYQGLYPGVDLTFYGNQHRLEYDFVVVPGADARAIRLAFRGAKRIHLDRSGQLVIETSAGPVRFDRPIVYQSNNNGSRTPVAGSFVVSHNEVSFKIATYDRTKPLVIDPVVNYATYLGGSGDENNGADSKTLVYFGNIVVASDGSAYLSGSTNSTNFPLVGAEQSTYGGNGDVFVAKLNATGTGLVYSTYLGGSQQDETGGLAVDTNGNAYVAGSTFSGNFPTTAGAIQSTPTATGCGFISKLNSSGSALTYSTYLCGTYTTRVTAVAVDANFNAYVTGTDNGGFPTTPSAYQKTVPGGENPFVAKLAVDGKSLVYSTYLGGENVDVGRGIQVDTLGNAYITGWTDSVSFPTTAGALQTAFGGGADDAFISKLNPTGTALVYSTYLGGSGDDIASSIAIDSTGNAYVTGYTASANFPTASPVQAAIAGQQDVFVSKLNAAGSALVYSTYLGGGHSENGLAIAVDSLGDAYVAGLTGSVNTSKVFPTSGGIPPYPTNNSYLAAFVTEYNPTGSAVVFSTLFGGNTANTYATGIGVDQLGDIIVTGGTLTTDLPTTSGALKTTISGNSDAFVVKMWPLNISPWSMAFPSTTSGTTSSPINITLTNSGQGTLNISSITVTGTNASNFGTSGNTCGAMLAAQSSCTIPVTFSPTAVQAYSASVTIVDSASPFSQVITLTGSGTAPVTTPQAVFSPTSIAFGNQQAGTSSAVQVVNLSNPGTGTLNITGLGLIGANTNAFLINSSCGTTLAPGANCNISVQFSPALGASGPLSATLTAIDNASSSPQNVTLTGTATMPQATLLPASLTFPATPLGQVSAPQTLTLTNTGTATLGNIIINNGGQSANFSFSSTCGSTLAVGASCTIQVTFNPIALGLQNATADADDNAPNSPQVATLSGTGTPAVTPQAVLSPGSLIFTTQTAGTTSASQTITLSNPASATLNISSITLGGVNPTAFALTNGCGATLAAGASCPLMVSFKPSGVASFSATVVVVDNAVNTPQSAALSGTGVAAPAPEAVLSPGSLTFVAQTAGTTSASQTVTLSNPGSAALSISSITVTGSNPTAFVLTNGCGTTLAVGASCPLSVTFTPSSAASFSAAITVADSATGSPQSAALSGTGIALPDFTTSSPTVPQTVKAGSAATYQISVTSSTGNFNLPVTLSASGLPTGFTATFTPASVTPGSTGGSSTLVIQTPATLARLEGGSSNQRQGNPGVPLGYGAGFGSVALAGLVLFRRMPRLSHRRSLLLLAIGLLLLSLGATGCGGGFLAPLTSKSYTITVTGTNGSDIHSTTISLTVD